MSRLKNIAQAACVLALWSVIPAIHAEPFLYVADAGHGQLVKVDVGAGKATVVGPFNQPGCDAIAVSPQGELFTVTQGWPPFPQPNHNPRLARVDAVTGNATPFGVNLSPEIFMGIGFSPDGTLYGVNAGSGTADQGSLYRFDPATGAATKVNVTGSCGLIMDLAVHPDGTLYGVDPSSLFRINPNTGEATLIVTTAHSMIMGLAIDDDGNFYLTEIMPAAPLLRLDPVTGATTPVPGVKLDWPHGLEFIPTPRSRPISIAFEKTPNPDGTFDGTVDTDLDGSPDGKIHYVQPKPARVTGQTMHFTGLYEVTTPFYAFTAQMDVVLGLKNGAIRANGTIIKGWLDGAQVHFDAHLVPATGGAAGVMRIEPGSR